MKFAKQSFSAILCIFLVAACSGSGGGSAAPTPTPTPTNMAKIDASSAETIAGGVVDSVLASGSIGEVVGSGGSGGLVGATDNGLSKVNGSQLGGVLGFFASVPIPDTTVQCAVEGSVILTGEVLNLNTVSAGDRLRFEFVYCNDGAGQVLNGIYEILINSISGDLLQGMIDLDATTTFDGFEIMEGSDLTTLNGGVTLELDTSMPPMTSVSVSGTSMSVSVNSDTATLSVFRTDVTHDASVVPEAYSSDASGTLTSTLFEGAVDYSTPVPFQGFAGEYPYQGELLVLGADGASVRLVALDNVNIRLEIDPGDGSGIVTQETTWTEVASPLIADDTGVKGIVIRGPLNPGPAVQGEVNEAPFSASFRVLKFEQVVARFESDENGNFSVFLPPGDYTIFADESAPILHAEQQPKPVTVPDIGFADVTLRFDTGIR